MYLVKFIRNLVENVGVVDSVHGSPKAHHV